MTMKDVILLGLVSVRASMIGIDRPYQECYDVKAERKHRKNPSSINMALDVLKSIGRCKTHWKNCSMNLFNSTAGKSTSPPT